MCESYVVIRLNSETPREFVYRALNELNVFEVMKIQTGDLESESKVVHEVLRVLVAFYRSPPLRCSTSLEIIGQTVSNKEIVKLKCKLKVFRLFDLQVMYSINFDFEKGAVSNHSFVADDADLFLLY